jgi:hypothetical protein
MPKLKLPDTSKSGAKKLKLPKNVTPPPPPPPPPPHAATTLWTCHHITAAPPHHRLQVKEEVHLRWYCGSTTAPSDKAVIEFIVAEHGALFEVSNTHILIYIYIYTCTCIHR